jgi:hypothetical protein
MKYYRKKIISLLLIKLITIKISFDHYYIKSKSREVYNTRSQDVTHGPMIFLDLSIHMKDKLM